MKNKSKQDIRTLLVKDIEETFVSFKPVSRNGWAIKFSTHRDSNILLILTSLYTGQTLVRYYTEERDAVNFINMMMTKNPQEAHEL